MLKLLKPSQTIDTMGLYREREREKLVCDGNGEIGYGIYRWKY